ncbi:MAG: thymidylate synthase [Candidatus Colwellbacteria bacterium]|nr:thymidylate synthase [Candidatus Colwellbacteria bacterium]
MEYRPIKERVPSLQYRDLLKCIIANGEQVDTQMEAEALRITGHMMRFRLSEGFPLITERDIASAEPGRKSIFEQALGELCAFLAGEHTQEGLRKYGCSWWKRWVSKEKCEKRGLIEGDLGPGSYGPAWRNFPMSDGGSFDQITNVIEQIKELPHLRTHFVSPWIPQYIYRGKGKIQKVVVVPCHGWFHILINTATGEMDLHHIQRSCDAPVGLVANLIQYGALLMMIAQVTGYIPRELVYTTSDTHIYVKQMKDVEDLLVTEPQPLPTIIMDPDVKNIFDFRPEHFKIEDYSPQLSRRVIWTPV